MTQLFSHKQRMLGADGLRAIACLWVINGHIAKYLVDMGWKISDSTKKLLAPGGLGVSIFFVLSGTLLSIPFWKAYHSGGPMPSIKTYAIHRLARIIPAYYLCLVVLFVLFNDGTISQVVDLVSALTFTNSFHWRTFFPMPHNESLWSIGVEMVFYVLLVLWMIGLFTFGRRLTSLGYLLLVLACLAAFNLTLLHYIPRLSVHVRVPNDERYHLAAFWLPQRNPFTLFTHVLLGVYAANIYLHCQRKFGVEKQKSDSPPGHWVFDALAVLLTTLIVLVMERQFLGSLPVIWRLVSPAADAANIPYHWPVFQLLVSGLLIVLPFSRFIGVCFDNVFFGWTARLSYGIYVWHMPILYFLMKYWHRLHLDGYVNGITFVLTAFGLSYLAAALSYYLIEKPVLDRVYAYTSRQGRRSLLHGNAINPPANG